MATRWRKRAFREVRDELDRFLNYPINQNLELGYFGIYDGKNCRFDWEGSLTKFGIAVPSAGFQSEIAETYGTAGAVKVQEHLHLSANPVASIAFERKTALAFRAHKIGFDTVQLANLEKSLLSAIGKGLEWNPDWVIITQLWQADGFTQLVSGGSKAEIMIEATTPGTAIGFNYADPTLGLRVASHQWMSYHAVGVTSIRPYFIISKLYKSGDSRKLAKYGLRSSRWW